MKFLTLVMILLNVVIITLPKATSDGSYGDYYDHNTNGVLGFEVYKDVCPEVEAIIFSWVQRAVMEDSRMAASLIRLHFHDCFVNACPLKSYIYTYFTFFLPCIYKSSNICPC